MRLFKTWLFALTLSVLSSAVYATEPAQLTVNAPTISAFDALQGQVDSHETDYGPRIDALETQGADHESRITTLEGSSGGSGVFPEVLNSPVSERYTTVPVESDSSNPRTIFYVVPDPHPVVGEVWIVSFEIHVTNDDLRAQDKGVAATTEVRLGYDTSHERASGFNLIRANGTFNIGVEAHHGLISRTKTIYWTQQMVDDANAMSDVVAKMMIWASSSGQSGQYDLEIGQNRGFFQITRFRP